MELDSPPTTAKESNPDTLPSYPSMLYSPPVVETSTWNYPKEEGESLSLPKPGRAAPSPPGKGIPMGGVRVSPEISLSSRWDDNIYKTATNLRADVMTQLKTVIKVLHNWAQNQADLSYSATVRRYQVLHTEDNVDQQLSLNSKFTPSRLVDVEFGYARSVENDERGTPGKATAQVNANAPLPKGPNTWLQESFKETARLKLRRLTSELKLEQSDRSSLNNGQSFMDRQWFDHGILFRWALSPKTSLLLDMGRKETTYSRSPRLDSTETRILTGVTWKGTTQTESQIKVGLTEKELINNLEKSSTGSTWEAGIVWQPTSRTRVNASSKRNFQDSEDMNESFIATTYQAGVDHTLTSHWRLMLGLEWINNEYDAGKREDFTTGRVGMDYRLSNHFSINTEVVNKMKTSTVTGGGFDSHAVQLSLTGSM
ncbi:outer membrane beta-barrel protein [Candidatus Magnetaquicoccus inordinatus]|uniref:outer membrane beta-barrel protein n=1 Tax=Candidatus Magnetaquicoccus inordinatus TaxID=2496818 RepID=UPI00187D330F|nr:outer membrane beta-barrel protein [Candidatus Magnetaquicoccus inordinatus]